MHAMAARVETVEAKVREGEAFLRAAQDLAGITEPGFEKFAGRFDYRLVTLEKSFKLRSEVMPRTLNLLEGAEAKTAET